MATAKQLQVNGLSSVERKTSDCEACGGVEATEMKLATVYCVDCQQKLCQECEEEHGKFTVTCRHKTVELDSETSVETESHAMPLSNCGTHVGEQVRIYCLECEVSTCVLCYIESHNSHKCSDIGKVADEFLKQMTVDIDNVRTGVDKTRDMLEKLKKEMNDFSRQVAKAKMEIVKKAEQLKQMIDVHKKKLMNELSAMKQKRMKEIESLREEIERQWLSMESYHKEVDEVRQKGTACDIARVASDLHNRADELLKFDVIERMLDKLGHADVTLTSSNFVIDDVNETLGQLRLNSDRRTG